MADTIAVKPYFAEVIVQPKGWLGDAFAPYRSACQRAGARYDRGAKGNLIAVGGVPRVVESLKSAGFDVEVDETLIACLEAEANIQRKLTANVDAEIERILTEAAERGLKPYPFQTEGIGWLARRDRAILADEMGLGKTIQALLALPTEVGVVILSPAVALRNWANEIQKWRPDLAPAILRGRGSFRWPASGECVILNYEILPDAVPAPTLPVVVIADEAHALKNPKAQRTQRFRTMAAAARAVGGRTWLMTGTPILNRPPELWSLLKACDMTNETFGSWPAFVDAFNGCKGRWGYEWGDPGPEVVDALRRAMLKRRREAVLPDLPTATRREYEVEILADDRKRIDEINAALKERGVDLEAAQDEADLKRHSGAAFHEISALRRVLATAKIPGLLDLVEEYEEQNEPLVVFSAHVDPIEVLSKRPGWRVIYGSTSPDEREEIVRSFQAGELKGIGLTIKAGGVAITLTRACHMVFVDLEWTPALNKQAEDRIVRIGQTRGVLITRLVADHATDRRVIRVLGEKQDLIDATVEAAAVTSITELEVHETTVDLVRRIEAVINDARPRNAGREPQGDDEGRITTRKTRRPARSHVERWASEGLVLVAGLDPDHAATINGVGFSKYDNDFGHSLAERLMSGDSLTDKQWDAVVRLARKYRRQIGPEPEEEVA